MNKEIENAPTQKFLTKRNGKLKDIFIIGGLGLALVLAAWKIFYTDEESAASVKTFASETEIKIARLLEEMDGVGEAEVVVCETEDGVRSAVVVCEGGNDLQVIMNVREAVASALGTDEKQIKIYVKKN